MEVNCRGGSSDSQHSPGGVRLPLPFRRWAWVRRTRRRNNHSLAKTVPLPHPVPCQDSNYSSHPSPVGGIKYVPHTPKKTEPANLDFLSASDGAGAPEQPPRLLAAVPTTPGLALTRPIVSPSTGTARLRRCFDCTSKASCRQIGPSPIVPVLLLPSRAPPGAASWQQPMDRMDASHKQNISNVAHLGPRGPLDPSIRNPRAPILRPAQPCC